MKITASKRDDIIRRRDEYDADAQARQDKYDAQYRQYRNEVESVYSAIAQEVLAQIPNAEMLGIEVVPQRKWDDMLEVRIKSHQDSRDEDTALRWDWLVYLDKDGNIKKESNSWSGLAACTEAQLDSLQAAVDALRVINNLDWSRILRTALPDYKTYITEHPYNRAARPNFERELFEADIEELIGKDILVEGVAGEGSGYRAGSKVYYLIEKETPKQYVVSELHRDYVHDLMERGGHSVQEIIKSLMGYKYRISKEKLHGLIGREIKTLQ